MKITFFKSDQEMWAFLGRAMKEADARVKPTQASIKPGQCYINMKPEYGLAILGEILDYKALGTDKEEQAYINETYEQDHMRFYRPCRAFSVACEFGEMGDVHLSDIDAIIEPALFQWYKEHGWVKPKRGDPDR